MSCSFVEALAEPEARVVEAVCRPPLATRLPSSPFETSIFLVYMRELSAQYTPKGALFLLLRTHLETAAASRQLEGAERSVLYFPGRVPKRNQRAVCVHVSVTLNAKNQIWDSSFIPHEQKHDTRAHTTGHNSPHCATTILSYHGPAHAGVTAAGVLIASIYLSGQATR